MIVTSCLYDTNGRNKTTLGGLGIKDEMCVGYLHYYPATKLSVCKSSVSEDSIKALSRFFNKSVFNLNIFSEIDLKYTDLLLRSLCKI